MVHKIPAVIGTSTDRKNIDLAFEQLGIGEFLRGDMFGRCKFRKA